jgi:phospholipid/cholesterol/gamma-HCH transport system ATP-binding protein
VAKTKHNGHNGAGAQSVIRVRGLEVGFHGVPILKGVDLDIKNGEVIGLVGASGGGKSVLTRSLIGLLPKWRGSIEVFGRDLDKIEERERQAIERRWGVLFQGGALFSSLTVRQNVQFPMRENLALSRRLLEEIALAKLEMVGLHRDVLDKMPSELSGGMVKRVALARALALDPEILFLDEPTSGLDPISAGDFDALIMALQETLGLTVFMVTHDLDSLYTACDRIVALADGKVIADGPIDTMLEAQHPWLRAYFHGKRAQARAGAEA